jgi:hypothetical protein
MLPAYSLSNLLPGIDLRLRTLGHFVICIFYLACAIQVPCFFAQEH